MTEKAEDDVCTEEKPVAASSASSSGGGFFSRFKKKKHSGDKKVAKEEKKKCGPSSIIFCFRKTRTVRNRKVKGKVKIDQTGNTELWQKIVDNSLVGTGVAEKAAICNIENGGIIAYNPQSFTPSVEQIQYLAGVTEEPDRASATGIKVADLHFIYRSGKENKALFGQGTPGGGENDDNSGVIIYRGQTKLLIVVYKSGRGDTAKKTCAELYEYFQEEENGF